MSSCPSVHAHTYSAFVKMSLLATCLLLVLIPTCWTHMFWTASQIEPSHAPGFDLGEATM